MSNIYKYHLGKNNNSVTVRRLLDDLLFQKKAEMTVHVDMPKHVELLTRQVDVINKRTYEFSDFSLIYFQEEYLSFEESLLLLVGINPDVLQNKYFQDFNLTNYSNTNYLATFMATRVNDSKFLRKSLFEESTQIKTRKFIKKTMASGYFTRELLIPKVANHRHTVKEHNLKITKQGLIVLLVRKAGTLDSAFNIARQLYRDIDDKLIVINAKGDKPKISTIRRYIGEIINSTDWVLQPESIRNKIRTKP